MITARIFLVRHGETVENEKGIYQGQMDTVLNKVGWEQARLVAIALRAIPIDSAYSSDLSRAVQVNYFIQ
jgi:probable phosphoglycerate mutase